MWGKFIWLMSAALISYLVGTSPWTKIQARRIWDEFLRRSAGPWSMIERIYRRIDSNLIGRIFLATLGLLLVILLVFWVTHIKFDLFKDASFKVTGWDDLRTLGWALSGVVATWLAIIGAILSAARTEAMEHANEATTEANRETKNKRLHERYENALKSIDGEGLSAIGAIETIKAVALQDQTLLAQTINILCSYLNRNAQIDDFKKNTCSKRSELRLHYQHALLALVELQRQRLITDDLVLNNYISLYLLDFRGVKIQYQERVSGFYFAGCNFVGAVFSQSKFVGVTFTECMMTQTILTKVEFKKEETPYKKFVLKDSDFEGAIISDVDFKGIESLEYQQMSGAKYQCEYPPKNFPCRLSDDDAAGQYGPQPARPILPPPWDSDKQQYWSMARWEKYKASEGAVVPLDQEGNEVPIVEPEVPESADTPDGDAD